MGKHGNQIIIMLFKGKLLEIMVVVYTKLYREYVPYESKESAMLYVEMNKVLYGKLQSELLFCKKLRKDLEVYNFLINPHDPCVANYIIEGQ